MTERKHCCYPKEHASIQTAVRRRGVLKIQHSYWVLVSTRSAWCVAGTCVPVCRYTVLYLTLPDATLTPRTGNSVLITPLLQVLQQVGIGHQVQTGTRSFIVRPCPSHLSSPCGFCKEPQESPCSRVPTGPCTRVLAHFLLLFLLYALKNLL